MRGINTGITAICGAFLLIVSVALSGCVAIPTSSSPQPIESLERSDAAAQMPTPTPGMDPETMVRAFLKATANPGSEHLAARQFLSAGSARTWDDRGSAVILSDINVLIDERSDDALSVRVVGDNTGSLHPDGHLTPASGRVETRLSLVRQSGQWRIDSLPSGVLMDRSVFQSAFRVQQLYFSNRAGDALVPDPRWLYATSTQLADQLVGYLLQGPSDVISDAVTNAFAAGSSLRGSIDTDGGGVAMDIAGLTDLTERSRTLLAAQVVWTLAKADVPGPYRINADGAPLMERAAGGWTTNDVAAFDPSAAATTNLGLHVIRQGALLRVTGTTESPVPGALGSTHGLVSAAISYDGARVAGVEHGATPDTNDLVLANYGFDAREVAQGRLITRPSFGDGHNTVWAVIDNRVTAITTDPTNGDVAVNQVDSRQVAGVMSGAITEFQVSRDGARAAMIVNGVVVMSTIGVGADGKLTLVDSQRVGLNIGGRAVALDWASGDTLVVARDTQDTPIVQIPINGNPAAGLLSSNLSPPVRAVVGDTSTIYAADTRGVMRLGSTNGYPDQYWNEVGPTMGSDSIPVLP